MDLQFSWKIVEHRDQEMKIETYFEQPEKVSSYNTDVMSIKILNHKVFID